MDLLNITTRQGPPTQFRSWHLLAAFRIFCNTDSPIGRYQLGTTLELGRGSIRSLIRFLRDQGLIEPVGRQGHQISQEGKRHCEILNHTLIKFFEVPPSSYTIDNYNYGCHLQQLAHHVTDGVQQRDAAIQAGASGATTFTQGLDPDSLIMSTDFTIPKTSLKLILEPFSLKSGDVLIIGSGPTRIRAQLGALAAALTLLQKSNKILT